MTIEVRERHDKCQALIAMPIHVMIFALNQVTSISNTFTYLNPEIDPSNMIKYMSIIVTGDMCR